MKTVKTLHFDFISVAVSISVSFDYMYNQSFYNGYFVLGLGYMIRLPVSASTPYPKTRLLPRENDIMKVVWRCAVC